MLFHKDALQETGEASLADSVIREIESPRRRVVGVVINAVDDHLLKGDQLDIRWSGDEIKVLPKLLYEARAAGRLVVAGHRPRPRAGLPDRMHGPTTAATAGEPPAVPRRPTRSRSPGPGRAPAESHRLIAPWSERVRYSVKKNGYHGGVTHAGDGRPRRRAHRPG